MAQLSLDLEDGVDNSRFTGWSTHNCDLVREVVAHCLDLLVAEGAVGTDGINAALEARRQNADGTVVRQRIIVLAY